MLSITNDMNHIAGMDKAIVAFTATWCQPCKQLKPQFAKAAVLDTINDYFVVDIDEIDKELVDKYNIRSVPTVAVMSNGNISNLIKSRTAPDIIKEVA